MGLWGRRKKLFLCCFFCIFVLLVSPIARLIHEGHFLLSTTIRKSKDLNEAVGVVLKKALKAVDAMGASPRTTQVNVSLFQELDAQGLYARLAQESLAGLHQMHAIQDHSAWYHGVSDAWALWVMMIMQCSVRACSDLPYDLESNNFRANLAWRALSGSDDVLWATLALIPYPQFLDHDYMMNGGRGAVQLYSEAERHYIFRVGNKTSFYWDTNRAYRSTISATLWIAASAQLYERTGQKQFLDNAHSALAGLIEPEGEFEPILVNGHVYDGRFADGSVQHLEFSYNAGVGLAALSSMYRATKNERYLRLAQEIVNTSLQVFWAHGELGEPTALASLDQINFKGLYLHYLADFLVTAKNSSLPLEGWVANVRTKLRKTSTFIVNGRLLTKGFCCHWGEPGAASRCVEAEAYPQCMVVASQVFTLLNLLDNF